MIVDTSAIVALLLGEPDAVSIALALDRAPYLVMSAPTRFETAMVIDKKAPPQVRHDLDAFLQRFAVHVEPFTERHADLARTAYLDYGKGSGHDANLNFGDCFAYALAKERGEPLLFVGDDFVHTDIVSAL